VTGPSDVPAGPPTDRNAELAAELERVVRREAAYRARAVQESLEYRKTIKNQARELKEQHDRAAGLDAYVHRLHLEREEIRKELRQATEDLEAFAHRLRRAEDVGAKGQGAITTMRRSWGWRLTAPLRALQAKLQGTPATQAVQAGVPGARFTYFLRTSPYRIYRLGAFTLEGWAFPEDGRQVTGVRVRIDDRIFPGSYGLEEPDVVRQYGPQPKNPKPGLRISFETPPGRHSFSLEACLDGGEWVSFLTTPIWAEAPGSGTAES
jgi:hypothetical protein